MLTLAERIDWILGARNLSARELAKNAGLSHTYIGLLLKGERGDQNGLTSSSARKIADAAGVDLNWLITGEGEPEPGVSAGGDPPALTQAFTLLGDRLSPLVKKALRAERPPTTWTVEQWIERGLHLQAVYDKLP
ncbi:MAG TPA: helix-turn-helix transcriptional regulator [Polyangiaceae bacterium]|nr:helix-turn-helix transcriptional regulator [Polyangiaceae bacterium]